MKITFFVKSVTLQIFTSLFHQPISCNRQENMWLFKYKAGQIPFYKSILKLLSTNLYTNIFKNWLTLFNNAHGIIKKLVHIFSCHLV